MCDVSQFCNYLVMLLGHGVSRIDASQPCPWMAVVSSEEERMGVDVSNENIVLVAEADCIEDVYSQGNPFRQRNFITVLDTFHEVLWHTLVRLVAWEEVVRQPGVQICGVCD